MIFSILELGLTLRLGGNLQDCIPDVDEAKDCWEKGRELTQGDDSHKKQNNCHEQKNKSKDSGFPIIEYSIFHRFGINGKKETGVK